MRNLAFDVSEQDLRAVFGRCGTIEKIEMPKHRDTRKPKGTALIQFKSTAELQRALQKDRLPIKGRTILCEASNHETITEAASADSSAAPASADASTSTSTPTTTAKSPKDKKKANEPQKEEEGKRGKKRVRGPMKKKPVGKKMGKLGKKGQKKAAERAK